MKTTIRNNVFETNNSSVHSLVLYKNKVTENTILRKYNTLKEKEKEIYLIDENFGVYKTPIEIIFYLYTLACQEHEIELLKTLKSLFPKFIWEKPKYYINRYTSGEPYKELANGFIDQPWNLDMPAIIKNILPLIFNGMIVFSRDAVMQEEEKLIMPGIDEKDEEDYDYDYSKYILITEGGN
jgi:hypothetical protein